MDYTIDGPWLIIPGMGRTMFWNTADILWLNNGNTPKLNAMGYLIMPYGNKHAHEVYT